MRISDWSSDVCSSDLVTLIEVKIGQRRRARGGQQHQPLRRRRAPALERPPVGVAAHIRAHRIIHPRPLQRGVGKGKSAGLDNMGGRPEAGGGAQDGADVSGDVGLEQRSEEHTSELQSLMRTSYAVFCLKKKNKNKST